MNDSKKLEIIVCSNLYNEIKNSLDNINRRDILLTEFPAFCINKKNRARAEKILKNSKGGYRSLLCSKSCSASEIIPADKYTKIYTCSTCFTHLIEERISEFFINEGYYLITSNWLNDWKKNIDELGFEGGGASEYFKSWCSKLIYLDAGVSIDAEKKLYDLSGYLGIEYSVYPADTAFLTNILKNIISDYRIAVLENTLNKNQEVLNNLRTDNAEYAASLNILSQVSKAVTKRDVIALISSMWNLLFGAREYSFISSHNIDEYCQSECPDTALCDQIVLSDKKSMTGHIFIDNKVFGIYKVYSFIHPEHIPKYLPMFRTIIRIASLALSNADKFEKLQAVKQKFEYDSFHDPLTGLKNRNFLNKTVSQDLKTPYTVFIFDINSLKYVNDTFGHTHGDELILAASRVLKRTFREYDTVIRTGGDEFSAIVFQTDIMFAEKILSRFDQEIMRENLNEKPYKLSISAGFSFVSDSSTNIDAALHAADLDMYEKKVKFKKSR